MRDTPRGEVGQEALLPDDLPRPVRPYLPSTGVTVSSLRRSPLRRKTRLKPVSDKQARYTAEYYEAIPTVKERSGGWCEIDAIHPCGRWASPYPHHRKLRAQGGSNDPHRNLLDVCWSGHTWIHRVLPWDEAVRLQLITPGMEEETPYRP